MRSVPSSLRKKTSYDVIVVGSGAAGGMAAFQLATRRAQGPAARGRPRGRHARSPRRWSGRTRRRAAAAAARRVRARRAEYNMLDRPLRHGREVRNTARSIVLGQPLHARAGDRRAANPIRARGTPGCGARARRQDDLLGPRGPAPVRLRLQGQEATMASAKTGRSRYADIAPYYDKVDRLLGISGTKENLPQLPDSLFQRPLKLNCGEMILQAGHREDGPPPHSRARRRHHRRRRQQQIPHALHGPGPLRPRVRPRRPFHSPTALIIRPRHGQAATSAPDRSSSEVLLDESTQQARASGSSTPHARGLRIPRQGGRARRLHAGDDAAAAELQIARGSRRPGELVRRAGPLLLRAHHGARALGHAADA